MSIIKHVTLQKIVAHDFPYDPRSSNMVIYLQADPSGGAVKGVGLRPLACLYRGFESRREHGGLSVVCVVCCQVEVSALGRSLVQRSST